MVASLIVATPVSFQTSTAGSSGLMLTPHDLAEKHHFIAGGNPHSYVARVEEIFGSGRMRCSIIGAVCWRGTKRESLGAFADVGENAEDRIERLRRDHDDPTNNLASRLSHRAANWRSSKRFAPSRRRAFIPRHRRALPVRANPDLLPIARQNDHARLAWL